jgi:hypothetical protein
MLRKQNRKIGPASGTAPTGGEASLLPEEMERVREQIAGRHSKSALQLAKDLYKRRATAESEALLIDAYKARIDDLLRLGMTVEAKTLLGIVRERFPSALPRMTELGREICAQDGKLEEVVAPLANHELPAEERERIETFVRQRIVDLRALGAVSSLPAEHSLRVVASALETAFQAVTKGPVEDVDLALPEVSRRNPLAPWKALIRAIACYHRHEDEDCGKWLQAIPKDSVPARLLPAFAAMLKAKLASGADSKLSLAEEKLIAVAGDHGADLRAAMSELEDALHGKKQKRILDAARKAMTASAHCAAGLRERLRQHIAVRCDLMDFPLSALNAALGGAPRFDAYYFRLLARALEENHNVDDYAEAAAIWVDFRREAIKENWFPTGGLEDGVLSLHMAELVRKAPAEVVEELRKDLSRYRRPDKRDKMEEWLPSPGALYERACKADPHPEAFQAWLNWARKQSAWQLANDVAERWREARAADIQPLLYLMESAEKRNAFKKSLKYLEEAEELDRLNPEVRRAKLRLLLSAAIRHLQQRKAHLARKDIEQIESVPEVRPGEIAALAAVLRWCAALADKDKAVQDEQHAQLEKSLGCVAAHLLKAAVAEKAEVVPASSLKALKVAKLSAVELLTGVARARALGEWAGLYIVLPQEWNGPLIAALRLPDCQADAAQLLLLGEAALDSSSAELAYAVSTTGLANGGASAEFLFLRARSLPPLDSFRREGCLTASLELARQKRNTELAGRILDRLNGKQEEGRRWVNSGLGADPGIASRAVSPELLGKILEEEQALKKFPGYNLGPDPKYAEELGHAACDCPKCRARRGEKVEEEEEFSDDEDDFDGESDFDEDEDGFEDKFDAPSPLKGLAKIMGELLTSMPPEQAQVVVQQLKKAIDDGEDLLIAVERIMGKAMLPPKPSVRPKKPSRVPPPEQGSLF